jgi:hypothetical protein
VNAELATAEARHQHRQQEEDRAHAAVQTPRPGPALPDHAQAVASLSAAAPAGGYGGEQGLA